MKKIFFVVMSAFLIASCCAKVGEGSYTIKGRVKDAGGKAIVGVVVSDGLNCVQTNAFGKYCIFTDDPHFVFVSTPSGYVAPVVDGKAQSYRDLSGTTPCKSVYKADFTLEKMSGNPDDYTVFMIGDPQPRTKDKEYDRMAYHSSDTWLDVVEDVKDVVASTDEYCFSFLLGDLVHEDMSLFPDYCAAIKDMKIATYSMLGNHDHDRSAMDDYTSARVFEDYLGPSYYSFNAGQVHYIVMDNIIMHPQAPKGKRNYEYGLTERQWQWLQNDLKFVDKTTPLVVTAHQPFFDMHEGEFLIVDEAAHKEDYTRLFSQFDKVYCWAGHRHHSYNCIYDEPELANIEQHIVPRCNGMFWVNEWINNDGTPRSYCIMKVRGKDISWILHPVKYQRAEYVGTVKKPEFKNRKWDFIDGVAIMKDTGKVLDESYQMNVFSPGAYGDGKVYASIFMWDAKWEEPVLEINGEKRPMEMKLMYDKLAIDVRDYYYTNIKTLAKRVEGQGWSYEDYQNLWGCDVSDIPHGKGTVSVKDRFGNVFKSDVEW